MIGGLSCRECKVPRAAPQMLGATPVEHVGETKAWAGDASVGVSENETALALGSCRRGALPVLSAKNMVTAEALAPPGGLASAPPAHVFVFTEEEHRMPATRRRCLRRGYVQQHLQHVPVPGDVERFDAAVQVEASGDQWLHGYLAVG
jgi:hypothetical protein